MSSHGSSVELHAPLVIPRSNSEHLRERDEQLAEAVAMGNALYEERDALERQLQQQAEREAQLSSAHAGELSALKSTVAGLSRDNAKLSRKVDDSAEDCRAAEAALVAVLEEACFGAAELQSDVRWVQHLKRD